MATLPYTKKMFIERIRKHVADGFPNADFSVSSNEILLYIDSALAIGLIGQVYNNAKVEGNLAVPEAYLTTYNISGITQDDVTGYWSASLPQTPVSLPLGYSISRVYFGSSAFGVSDDAYPIKAKEVAYINLLPLPAGVRYWVENKKIWLAAYNSAGLSGLNLYVQMAKTRTDDVNEDMALPDDAMQAIFEKVVQQLLQRYQIPQDIVSDGLAAGNKSS